MRAADAEQPPAAVVRRTEHRASGSVSRAPASVSVARIQVGGVHADLDDRRARGAAASWWALHAAGSRSPSPRWGCTVQAAVRRAARRRSSASARSPSSARWQRPTPYAATHTARVSSSAAAASSAARSMPTTRPSRVLTAPATGAFATTSITAGRIGGSRQHPGEVPGRRGPCRPPSRTPSSGCRPPGGGSRCRARRTATAPGRALEQLDRVAEATVLDAEGEQPLAPGHPHRRDVVQRQPEPAAQPPQHHGVAGARVPRPDAAAGRPAPTDREVGLAPRPPGRAAAAGRADPSSRRRPSPRRSSAVAASRPACTAAP